VGHTNQGRFYFIWIAPFLKKDMPTSMGAMSRAQAGRDTLRQRTLELQQLNATLEQRVQEGPRNWKRRIKRAESVHKTPLSPGGGEKENCRRAP
jgi:hypothetical protein